MNQRLKIKTLMIGVVLLIVQSSSAFWRGSPLELEAGWPVHESITIEALTNVPINLGNNKTSIFELSSVKDIASRNAKADDDQTPSHHFDNDTFRESSQRLIQLRKELVFTLLNPSFLDFSNEGLSSRQPLTSMAHYFAGEALHTLQDFYSHTNWVERNGADQKNLLQIFGKGIVEGGYTPGICDVNDFKTSPLTSGWALGKKPGLIACTRPENKCPHGFITPCLDGEEPNIDIHPGLNKDYYLRDNHDVARLLALDATRDFIRKILLEVLEESKTNQQWIDTLGAEGAANVGRSAVCHFMGMREIEYSCLTTQNLAVKKLDSVTRDEIPTGKVVSELAGIDCGGACAHDFIAGSSITLTASNGEGWGFKEWDSPCRVMVEGVEQDVVGSNNPDCKITMDSDKVAKAVFEESFNYTLVIAYGRPSYEDLKTFDEVEAGENLTVGNGLRYHVGLKLDGQPVDYYRNGYAGTDFWIYDSFPKIDYGSNDQQFANFEFTGLDATNNRTVNIPINLTVSNQGYRNIAGRTFTLMDAGGGYIIDGSTMTFEPFAEGTQSGKAIYTKPDDSTIETTWYEYFTTANGHFNCADGERDFALLGGFKTQLYLGGQSFYQVMEDHVYIQNTYHFCPERADRRIVHGDH